MRKPMLAAGALALLVTGCAGVPVSSAPQVIGPVGGLQSSSPPTNAPEPGADQRSVVKGFLSANTSDDPRHTAARAFLTPEAKNRWSDTTVTVVKSELIGNFEPGDSTVTVSGRPVGTLSAAGVYTPVLKGNGDGGDSLSFVFGVKRASGEWRIDTLKNGLVITEEQFKNAYRQKLLYFFDLAETRLVPDTRYTALVDANLADWLVNQLVVGPRPELQNGVNTELPAQTDPHRVAVEIGTVTTVEVPGAGQLDPATRTRLAAQLAHTLDQVTGSFGSSPIEVTDGGHPVQIPAVGQAQFTKADFPSVVEQVIAAPPLYYIRLGAVVDSGGAAVSGHVGSGEYGLTSVALTSLGASDVGVAGTRGPRGDAQLLVGTVNRGLHQATVQGPLSRPAWAPHIDEVWVGDGSTIDRVASVGVPKVVQVTTTGGKLAGQVSALRFSPEGSRIAMVLSAPDGSAQVWVGAVVRNAEQVRVDNLEPVSPLGFVAVDVAWNGPLTLFTIGHDSGTGESSIFDLQVDGAWWTLVSSTNLPGAPDSITVAEAGPAWVSVGNTVFTQHGSLWSNPGSETTAGTNPVYLE